MSDITFEHLLSHLNHLRIQILTQIGHELESGMVFTGKSLVSPTVIATIVFPYGLDPDIKRRHAERWVEGHPEAESKETRLYEERELELYVHGRFDDGTAYQIRFGSVE